MAWKNQIIFNSNQKSDLDDSWASAFSFQQGLLASLAAWLHVCLFAIFLKNCSLDFCDFLHVIGD